MSADIADSVVLARYRAKFFLMPVSVTDMILTGIKTDINVGVRYHTLMTI